MSIPFLPGNTFADPTKSRFHKSHVFDVKSGIKVMSDRPGIGGSAHPPTQTKTVPPSIVPFVSGQTTKEAVPEDHVPAWIAFDKKVLRFNAYFKEAVHESRVEQYRIRRCIIYYYLEDDSFHVSEPRVENSGIPQGTFIKRHRIPKPNTKNEYYSLEDVNIGKELTFYGRTFRVTSADSFTRNFCEKVGIQLGAEEDIPKDQYTLVRADEKDRVKPVGPPKPKDDDLARYVEAKLGRATNVLREDTLKQFLENDRKVLRFYCLWDDRESLYGDRRQFILHYFLADDSIEILEVNVPNSGRDPFPALLKRQKVPKNPQSINPGNPGADVKDCFTWQDLQLNTYVRVYNRDFLLYDCDEYTRAFFHHQQVGLPEPIEVEEPLPEPPKMEPPPYNGFGTEEDSLGSFLYLVPKAPKKDFQKIISNDRKILRFVARMDTSKPEDVDRRFVVQYYLADDTLQVYEPPQRNSGIVGGKFLERMRIKKPHSGEYYLASDLFVGAIVEFHRHRLILTEADVYTYNYMESKPGEFPLADINLIQAKLQQKILESNIHIRKTFREIDYDKNGVITYDEFRRLIFKYNLGLTDQEIITLMRRYDTTGDGLITYEEFCDAILPKDYGSGAGITPRTADNDHLPVSQEDVDHYKEAEENRMRDDAYHNLITSFIDRVQQKKRRVYEMFRALDENKSNCLGRNEFAESLRRLDFNLGEADIGALVDHFFGDNDEINYEQFIHEVTQ